jgi:hypothetical protein
MKRGPVVVGILVVLGALFTWQYMRERQVTACVNAGGRWNGPKSLCEPARPGLILQRDLHRS